MRNGRCRLHGGKSTGPRTEEGRARIRAARTRHGRYTAESRAFQSNITGLLRRSRELLSLVSRPGTGNAALDAEALRHLLPPDLGKNLLQQPAPGLRPRGGTTSPPGARSNPLARQNPIQRETTPPPQDPRFREDDEQDAASAPKHPVQREKPLLMTADARQRTQMPDCPSPPPSPDPLRSRLHPQFAGQSCSRAQDSPCNLSGLP
jgi:hypothetical protein